MTPVPIRLPTHIPELLVRQRADTALCMVLFPLAMDPEDILVARHNARLRVAIFALLVDLIIRAVREDKCDLVLRGHDILDMIDPAFASAPNAILPPVRVDVTVESANAA